MEKIHDILVKQVRKIVGKNDTPTVGIIDSKDLSKRGSRGYDAGKGQKRHIIVDTVGLVIAAEGKRSRS